MTRGYYVKVCGEMYSARTKKARWAIAAQWLTSVPIVYWNGQEWKDTGRILYGLRRYADA